SSWYLLAATYALPGENLEASIIEMRAHSGSPGGVTFFQVFPPSRVTCISPSSEPAQITPAVRGDSAMVKTVAKYSTDVWSLVIGPPEGPSVRGSWRVRSGLIGLKVCPSSSL